ncbi:Ger(x)C family spore germination protein [Pseudalkalibacillus berkeleyi]|uniref:Ger(X)C family spore germination protein n=1 Tax=Pseudalkalibacillus berkeleyi TaxID=1069813 RepID=A0ABS9GXF7_9BACL|nr:Ger(x)C family spore germination protein [Pseudalkalibacillus berkeleyi]MCF6137462.1 Ger(x)C family spore germination protein [Pseudalkalibacillus berkeleyi]
MKSVTLLIILCTSCLLLSGCWNSRELNEIGIAVGLGIDKTDDGQILLTVQLVNPSEISSKQSSGTRAPIVTYQEKGDSVFEALRRMTKTVPRKTFFPHLRMLVIGENVAKEGMASSLDLLERDQEFRPDFYVVIAQEHEAQEILELLVPVEKITAQNLFTKLETSSKVWAPTVALTFGNLLNEFTSEGKHPVLSGVHILGDQQSGKGVEDLQSVDPSTRLKYENLAVFKGDQLKGWLNESESKGYNYITGNVKSTIVNIPCKDDSSISIEILRTKSKIKSDLNKNQPAIDIKLKATGNVGEVECPIDLQKSDTIKKLEKQTEKDIKKQMQNSLKVAQDTFQLDIFGFGEEFHRKEPKYWATVKSDWDQTFTDLPVRIEVDVQIRQTGRRSNSYINNLKE